MYPHVMLMSNSIGVRHQQAFSASVQSATKSNAAGNVAFRHCRIDQHLQRHFIDLI